MSLETPIKIRMLQRKLYQKAKEEPSYRFYLLYDKMYREDVLAHAYALVRSNQGAPGVDGQSFRGIESQGLEEWLSDIREDLRAKTYRPQAVRRVMIPKPGGGERPLGIPTIRDRVVQTAAKLLLEPIFEADFDPNAYGYRPKRSAQEAIQKVHKLLCAGYADVVDADLSKYFDTIPHSELMQCVARRIVDRDMLRLIKMWLKVPVEERDENGQPRVSGGKGSTCGTPQGGVISPLLANLYMNRFLKYWRITLAREANIPILVDAAADYLIVPNPYIALGADLVAYSGGKIIRGPQNAGLLIGRRDLVRAAWANSSPHHAFGRGLKVSKEAIVGMLRAVEIWRSERDVQADFREWESWYAEISEVITRVPSVQAEVRGPVRGGPFPVLNVSWDPEKIGLTARQVGRMLLEGDPRIMTHAEGEGHSFLLRPVAMKAGEHKIVARRLHEVFSGAPARAEIPQQHPPAVDISGAWDVDIEYEVGSSRHKLLLVARGNRVTGFHEGWAYRGDLTGEMDGSGVRLRSSLPADGNHLSYVFSGVATEDGISGDVELGEYGRARWRARRHANSG